LIPTRTASSRSAGLCGLIVALLAVSLGAGACKGEDDDPAKIEPGQADCTTDSSEDPTTAAALAAGTATGFICPVEDEDWYTFTVPANDHILNVQLSLSEPISAVQPTYAVFEKTGDPPKLVAQPPAAEVGTALSIDHCVAPGDYVVVVRDDGSDAQDYRHPYTVTINSQPDPDPEEPNDDKASAITFQAPSMTGAIACRGDQDWYRVTVPQGNIVQLKLTSAIATYEPTLRLYNGADELIAMESNLSGSVRETAIDRYVVVGTGGDYWVQVSDDDGENADPNVTYQLGVSFIPDVDPNEPNNHPDEATPVSAQPLVCGGSWTGWMTLTGSIGSPGDNDWYAVPLQGCDKGVLEVEMAMNSPVGPAAQRALNAEVQASISVVRAHTDSPCQDDSECATLNIACEGPRQCNRYFGSCLPEGLCAGAVVCLPTGTCGGTVVQRRWRCEPSLAECQASSNAAPPPNMVRTAIPILGEDLMYVRASDFQSDGAAPDVTYTLRVRVRSEPDPNEPDNIYLNELSQDINESRPGAGRGFRALNVLDCTTGSCCDSSPAGWLHGTLSTENDLDWLTYLHPCPGEDCTLRVRYETDPGAVDFVITVHQGDPEWFTAFDTEELDNQPAHDGALGGTTAADSCFYAYHGHGDGEAFRYYISVRDINGLFPNTTTVDPLTHDWSSEQGWRLCVEKVSNICLEPPCQIDPERGCDVPQN